MSTDRDARTDVDAPACPYCGRRFSGGRLLELHLGEVHPARLDESEWSRVESARAAEDADLRRLRLRAAILLVLLYFGFVVLYAAVRAELF